MKVMSEAWHHDWLVQCLAAVPEQNQVVPPHPVVAHDEADWAALIRLAERHDVVPLLYHQLHQAGRGWGVTERVRGELRQAFLVNGARNALHYHELAPVLRALRTAGIPCLVLKGAHLAALVYSQPALRTMADIDLLVPVDALLPAGAVLRSLGYADAEDSTCGAVDETVMHLPRMFKPPGLGIEVHHTISRPQLPFCVDVEGLWQRSRTVELAGESTQVLSPEDVLLYLCLHTASHARESQGLDLAPFLLGLKPLCDIVAMVRRHGPDLDWAAVRERATAWRAGRCVFLSLWLAQDLLGLEVPASVLESLRPADFADDWAELARKQIRLAGTEAPDADVLRTTFAPWMEWDKRRHTGERRGWLGVLFRALIPSRDQVDRRVTGAGPATAAPGQVSSYFFTRTWRWSVRIARMTGYALRHPWQTARYVRHIRNQMRLWNWLEDQR